MLKSFGHDIWIADGSMAVAVAGFHYPTRMAVIRLPNDALFVWSPIPLTDELREQVTALGSVEHLTAPKMAMHSSSVHLTGTTAAIAATGLSGAASAVGNPTNSRVSSLKSSRHTSSPTPGERSDRQVAQLL
ncbi:hypothetical protein [Pararhizobium sp. IMCC21322]|uniref:hypothetical protein n=1 Tax=Pararhizobium sp. IMCC21322 TaxID=3067903 RepID=UPI00274176A4|nr:hypothetical protein [Pararhizobium sp. IMCC21322]